MLHFKNLLDSVERSDGKKIRILDAGGSVRFWERVDFSISKFQITVVNLIIHESTNDGITSIYGDVLDLSSFPDDSFDVIFSNSVIEHVGSWENQVRMSHELLRFNSPIFLQTPNFWFPMEPHFLFPFFQFLPLKLRALLLYNFNLGGYDRAKTWDDALNEVRMIRLLTRRNLRKLFPGCKVKSEKVYTMASGLLVISGWPEGS